MAVIKCLMKMMSASVVELVSGEAAVLMTVNTGLTLGGWGVIIIL